ncbi:Uncharacterised protein [Mycobacteroides abscessus subsp. abscessus]|nr:Uncharacterised protein [Mycobacteroides abscessus subsp. abscessus]
MTFAVNIKTLLKGFFKFFHGTAFEEHVPVSTNRLFMRIYRFAFTID